MVHPVGENDQVRNSIHQDIQQKIRQQKAQRNIEQKYGLFIEKLKIAVYRELVSQEKSQQIIQLVESGKMDIGIATNRLYGLIKR